MVVLSKRGTKNKEGGENGKRERRHAPEEDEDNRDRDARVERGGQDVCMCGESGAVEFGGNHPSQASGRSTIDSRHRSAAWRACTRIARRGRVIITIQSESNRTRGTAAERTAHVRGKEDISESESRSQSAFVPKLNNSAKNAQLYFVHHEKWRRRITYWKMKPTIVQGT